MKAQATRVATLALASTFAGCASMPKVTVGYYDAQASLDVLVTQTGTCTTGNVPVFTDDVKLTPKYFADVDERHTVDLSKLGNGWSKADGTFEFFADGRLKSINAKQTGQAGEVLRAAVKLVTQVAPSSFTGDQVTTACERLRKIVGDGKTLTIVHRGHTDFMNKDGAIAFTQTGIGRSDYATLRPIFGTLAGNYTTTIPATTQHDGSIADNDGQELDLVEPGVANVNVTISRGEAQVPTWNERVLVPQHGTPYTLAIQKGPAFGNNEFELVLHDSGKVTKLRYAGAGDTAEVLGVISDARAATAGESLTDEVNRTKAEADLIFQQQRLVLCQTDPVNCPK